MDPPHPAVSLESILAAHLRIKPFIYRSPCERKESLSTVCGCDIYCKLDNLQHTGSFKERGARNKLMLLSPEERARGVICVSAGNHALALSYHGAQLGIKVTVVMPIWAPLVKVQRCRATGAEVIQHGEQFGVAAELARKLAEERQLVFVSPYDDAQIIAGQGTLGLEILEDVPDADVIIVPVGGGGLISGIATAVKAARPDVRIIGVESTTAQSFHAALAAGKPVYTSPEPTLADGLAVARTGDICFEISSKLVDEFTLVDEGQIAQAILRLLEWEKIIVEGAGAVPLAAAMTRKLGLEGKKVVLLMCGGNIDITTIARIIDRGLAQDGRLCRVTMTISDRPGSLARTLAIVASVGVSIKDTSHDRSFGSADIAKVTVTLICETRDREHIAQLHETLRNAGIEFYAP